MVERKSRRKKVKIFNKTGGRKKCPACSSVDLKTILREKGDKNEYGFECRKCGYKNIREKLTFRARL